MGEADYTPAEKIVVNDIEISIWMHNTVLGPAFYYQLARRYKDVDANEYKSIPLLELNDTNDAITALEKAREYMTKQKKEYETNMKIEEMMGGPHEEGECFPFPNEHFQIT